MRLTESLINTLNGITYLDTGNNSTTVLHSNLGVDKNNLFNKYLIVDLSKNKIDIPEIAGYQISKIINEEVRRNTHIYKQVAIPLYENNFMETRKTFDAIIKSMFSSSYINRLQRINLSDDSVYFGCKGIILDNNFNPLLLAVSRINKEIKDAASTATYIDRVLYISPKVFEEPKKLINKGIINKIIPYFSQTKFVITSNFGSLISRGPYKPYTIIVSEYIDKFFTCPSPPRPVYDIDNSLNECLINSVEDILQ